MKICQFCGEEVTGTGANNYCFRCNSPKGVVEVADDYFEQEEVDNQVGKYLDKEGDK